MPDLPRGDVVDDPAVLAVNTPVLFDMAPAAPRVLPALTAGQRRLRRQLAVLAAGKHPLTYRSWRSRLHPHAAPVQDRAAPGRRCGNCRFRRVLNLGHARSFPKCVFGWDGKARLDAVPRISRGEATDCRSWWPGCADHEYGDAALPDAMRWVPEPGDGR